MKLRMRLFLWMGGLFVLAFSISFIFEEYATRTNLNRAELALEKDIEHLNEIKRENIEHYIANSLSRAQGDIDALLARVGQYTHMRDCFAPTLANAKRHTWLNSASLKITHPYLDFIQNLNEDEVAAMIVTDPLLQNEMKYEVLDENSALVMVKQPTGEWTGPYVGIRIEYHFDEQVVYRTYRDDPVYYVMFTPETVEKFDTKNQEYYQLDLSLNFLEPLLRWIEVPSRTSFMSIFLKRFEKVQSALKGKMDPTWLAERRKHIMRTRPIGHTTEAIPSRMFIEQSDNALLKKYIEDVDARVDQTGMVWGLAALLETNSFGHEIGEKENPVGMARVIAEDNFGEVLLTKQAFHKTPYKEFKGCQEMFAMYKSDVCLANNLTVIKPPNQTEVFFGNTLKMETEGRTGYLTIGINNWRFLEQVALAMHQKTAFISNEKVINVVNADGTEDNMSTWINIPVGNILKTNSGTIDVAGTAYYYLHMQPFKDIDFHFVIFNPSDKEFALLRKVKVASQELINRISLNMRIAVVAAMVIVLLVLSGIAKQITTPITHLAQATKAVNEGRLDEIQEPEKETGRRDEVYALYHSFFEMVKGLKEKERVRGVLNKVVSPEIAQATLAGNVQLGGEEKLVTVFFADIRNFTGITEKMDPKNVIELLNKCMTRISNVIDRHSGVIDKYVGDEVMALFGAPVEKEDSALNAVQAGLEIIEELKKWNIEREAEGKPPINMGVGIHTGIVVAGNMGAENRLNYTVLGSNVNLAARLCGEAAPMQVLISSDTLSQTHVAENITVEEIPDTKLKGFTEITKAYTVISKNSPNSTT